MKLHEQILTALVSFFGLNEGSTESEVHQTLIEKKPLTELISEAATGNAQIEALTQKVNELTEKVATMQETMRATAEANEESAKRVIELEGELKAANEATQAAIAEAAQIKAESAAQVSKLAGEISALKVGQNPDQNAFDQNHAGGNQGGGKATVITVKDSSLTGLLKKA